MALTVELPALGESVVEGTVSRWLVKEGQRVEIDQPLLEVTTDKVDAEIPSPAAGVVSAILVSEGETVPVGARLLTIEVEIPAGETEGAAAVDAREPKAEAHPATRPDFPDYQLQPDDKVVPMTPLRRRVAQHMLHSKRVSPHAGTVAEIDMGAVSALRDAHGRSFREANGFSLSFLPFVAYASARALREFPRLNASVLEDAIVEKGAVHIGIAVETGKGLLVPVVRHADRLSVAGIARAVEELAQRARNQRLSADELTGGTFTLSNPGSRGNLYGFAIINQPQVGILRMGEITKRPVVRRVGGDDGIVIRPLMHLALSYDHRAVDGAPANAFLYRVREFLEEGEFDL